MGGGGRESPRPLGHTRSESCHSQKAWSFQRQAQLKPRAAFPRGGGWGRGLLHPQPGSEVIVRSVLPAGEGLGLWGTDPTPRLTPWQALRHSREPRGPPMAPPAGGVFVREEGGMAGGGGAPGACQVPTGCSWVGAAARRPAEAPRKRKVPAKPPGTHPRLSLSEATRLRPPLAGSVPPPGRRPVAFFPAQGTCTNIDSNARSSGTRAARKLPPRAQCPRREQDPCLRLFATSSPACHPGGPRQLCPRPQAGGDVAVHPAFPICPQPVPAARAAQLPWM